MTVLMAGKNQKESLIMEVNSDILMEFTANRRARSAVGIRKDGEDK